MSKRETPLTRRYFSRLAEVGRGRSPQRWAAAREVPCPLNRVNSSTCNKSCLHESSLITLGMITSPPCASKNIRVMIGRTLRSTPCYA